MSVSEATLQALFDLAPGDKLLVVQALWDDLASHPQDVPVHDWQIREIERRKADFEKNPSSGLTLAQFKKLVEGDAQ